MSDLTSLLEEWGDPAVLSAGGALIGLLFGLAAQRSRFCARAAVMACCQQQPQDRLAVWLLAFASALLGVQALVLTGALQPSASRFVGQSGSVSGAVLGGLCFGAGMILTRGCASRLLILSAGGNLRALLSGLVFAVTVQASISGLLAPLRQTIASWWPLDPGPQRALLTALGLPPVSGLILGAGVLALALWLWWRQPHRTWQDGGWALLCGLAISAGWAFTQAVAGASFEAVPVMSLSYSAPSAEWLMRVLATSTAPQFGFDTGVLPATFAGALIGALLGRDFKFEGFRTENKLGHYLIGAMLMGFGAVSAGGCTVGAGMTGGAMLAITALLTLGAIWVGAGLNLRLHRAMGWPV